MAVRPSPGMQFTLLGETWEILNNVNSSDGQAFLENRGHDDWVARNRDTRGQRVFTGEFLTGSPCVTALPG